MNQNQDDISNNFENLSLDVYDPYNINYTQFLLQNQYMYGGASQSKETVPAKTLNRQGASGLQAVVDVVTAIKAGFYDIGGVESMSTNAMPTAWEGSLNPKVQDFKISQDCLIPMGITAENVAARFGITRREQDLAAVESHRRAAAANASGKFRDEIVPVKTKIVDLKTGEEKCVTIISDDGIRPKITVSDLAKLKPAFKKDGTMYQNFHIGLRL